MKALCLRRYITGKKRVSSEHQSSSLIGSPRVCSVTSIAQLFNSYIDRRVLPSEYFSVHFIKLCGELIKWIGLMLHNSQICPEVSLKSLLLFIDVFVISFRHVYLHRVP